MWDVEKGHWGKGKGEKAGATSAKVNTACACCQLMCYRAVKYILNNRQVLRPEGLNQDVAPRQLDKMRPILAGCSL